MSEFWVGFCFYFIGSVASFVLPKIVARRMEVDNNWGFVIFRAVMSIFSWFTVIGWVITYGLVLLVEFLDDDSHQPPKWL